MRQVALVLVLTAAALPARAQPAPTPAPPSAPPGPPPAAAPAAPGPGAEPPPEYGPPPGYQAPPPQGYQPPPGYGQYPARPYQPPPPTVFADDRGLDRDFTIGFGIGFGGLNIRQGGRWDGASGLSYTLKLGFGIARNLILAWNVEGTSVAQDLYTNASQTAHLATLYYYPGGRRLFLKGGLGAAYLTRDDGYYFEASEWGFAGSGGLGYEILQGWHTAFDIEFSATFVQYRSEGVGFSNGLNFVIAWY